MDRYSPLFSKSRHDPKRWVFSFQPEALSEISPGDGATPIPSKVRSIMAMIPSSFRPLERRSDSV
jgi:hypothetical protein